MNKLFTKIAALALGATMAVGVGVAVASNSREVTSVEATTANGTAATSITSGKKYLVTAVYSSKTYYLTPGSEALGTGKVVATEIPDITKATESMCWTFTGSGTSWTIAANGFYLANTNTNNGVKTQASSQSWTSSFSSTTLTLTGGNSRKLALYQGENWRCYSTSSGVQSLKIYEYAAPATYTVSFAVNTAGYGTVSRSSITNVPSGTSITTSNNTVTINGTTVTATPTANTAQYTYAFTGWSNNTGTVTAARTITANFSRTTNKFTVSDNITNGSLDDTSSIEYGGDLAVQIVPDSGYSYPSEITVTMGGNDITGDVTYDDSDGTILYEGVTGNIVIEATCPSAGTIYEISTTVNNGTYTGATEIISGFTASITFTPNDHYKLPADDSAFTVSHAEIQSYNSSTGVLVLENPDDDVTVSVSMVAKAQNTISMGTLTGVSQADGNPTSVEEGATVTLTFTANEGYGLPTSSGVTVTGTGSSSTWTQGTGKLQITGGTGNITVSITGIVRSVTSISLSSNSGSYTLGDTFVMPTVTANYNVGASEDVTASATATGGGLENGVLTSAGTKTITISYGGQSATYTATVTAVVPSAGGIAKITSTSDLTVGSTVYLVCEGRSKQLSGISTTSTKYGLGADYTTTPANTYPLTVCAGNGGTGYAFKNSSNNYLYWTSGNSLNQDSSLSNNTSWTVSFDDDGNATILNVADSNREIMWNYSSPRFACYSGQTPTYDTTSGYNMVQIYKNYPSVVKSLKWITAEVKSGTYYQGSDVTASDFTVTAHYDDGTTSTPTSDITVTNATLTVIGSNTVTLTYGGKSCNVTVTAVEQTAEYTGLAWSQGEYNIIDGQEIDFSKFGKVTAEYDDGDSYETKSIAACSVATYTKSGDVYTKVADLDDGDEITSSSHGKYLGVTYTETNTYTAYSSAPIYVVEAIEDVYIQVPTYTWNKVTSINDGDVVTFVEETDSLVASGMGTNIINATSYDETVSTSFYFTVGEVEVDNNTYYTFHNENGYLGNHSTGTSGNNNAYLDAEIDEENNKNYFTVSFDEGDVVITSVYDNNRVLQLRSGNTKDRFCFYGSTQLSIQLYKGTAGYSPTGDNIANTNVMVQKAVLEFAEHFNDTMNCVNSGSTVNVASKWSTLSSDFSTAMSGFTGDDLTHFKALFANAYSVEGGDTLQDMLARYEYICGKYKLTDFLHNGADRPPVAQRGSINLITIINSKTDVNVVAIVVITSVISLTAIGGYFFLRKRREQH